MTSTTKPFSPILSTAAETSFISMLFMELPELKAVSSERLKSALDKAMAYAISENCPSLLSVVKTEESLSGLNYHVSEPLHCVKDASSRQFQTARDLDIRFQVLTSLKNRSSIEQCLRIDLGSLKSTIGIPLFELDTCIGYVEDAVQKGTGLHKFEAAALLKVVKGLDTLNREANLEGMSNFDDLDVYDGPEVENFFGSELKHKEVVGYLREQGRLWEGEPGEQFPEFDKCACSVALYQLACVLDWFPDYLQECYELLEANA